MGKLTAEQRELWKRCDEVLHYVWDPIGVAGEPRARDEYDSYVPQVFRMLCEGEEERGIADHLSRLETDQMGLLPTGPHVETAAVLVAWRGRLLGAEG